MKPFSTTLEKRRALRIAEHTLDEHEARTLDRCGYMFANPCAASATHGIPWVLYPCALFFADVVRFNHQAACEFGLQAGMVFRTWCYSDERVIEAALARGEKFVPRWQHGVFENMVHGFTSRTEIHKHGAYVLRQRQKTRHKQRPDTMSVAFELSTRSPRGLEVVRQIPELCGRLVRLYSHPHADPNNPNDRRVNWMIWRFADLANRDYQRSHDGKRNLADDHRYVLKTALKESPRLSPCFIDDADECPVH